MIDSTDANVIEESLKRTPGKSLINSINLEDGEERFERVVRSHAVTAPRWSSAVSTRTSSRPRPSRAIASCSRRAILPSADRKVWRRARGYLSSTRWSFRSAPATAIHWLRRRDHRGNPPDQGVAAARENDPGHVQRLFGLPDAGREVLNSVMLYHACKRARSRIVNSEKLDRYPVDSRRGAAAGRGSDLVARRRSDCRLCGVFPRAQGQTDAKIASPAARRSARPLYPRRFARRSDRRSRRGADHAQAARNHQRSPDEGHG